MENLKKYLTNALAEVVEKNWEGLVEIRLRVHQPLILEKIVGEEIFPEIIIEEKTLKELLNKITKYSLYAYEREIKQGYLAIEGGHRVGLAGESSEKDGTVNCLKHITFMNIRVCRTVKNYGEELFEKICFNHRIYNTLIVSSPGMGKTTLLRSLICKCSNQLIGTSIMVIDERNEISGGYRGIPQINLGIRTDVMTGMDKVSGIIRAVRSMGPKIIVVDELGEQGDMDAIRWAMNSGTDVIATVHGNQLQDVRNKMGDNLFQRFRMKVLILERGKYQCFCEESEQH